MSARVAKINAKQFDSNRIFFAPLPIHNAQTEQPHFELFFEKDESFDHDIGYRRIWRLFFMHAHQLEMDQLVTEEQNWPKWLDFAVDVTRPQTGTFDLDVRKKTKNSEGSLTNSAQGKRNLAWKNCQSVQSPCPVQRFNSESFEVAAKHEAPTNSSNSSENTNMITLLPEDLWKFTIQQRNMQYGYVQNIKVENKTHKEWVPADINCQVSNVAEMDWNTTEELDALHHYVKDAQNRDLNWTYVDWTRPSVRNVDTPEVATKFLHATSAALRAPRIRKKMADNISFQPWERTPACMEADIFEHKALLQRCENRAALLLKKNGDAEADKYETNNQAAMYALNVDPPMFDMAEQAYRQYLQYRQLVNEVETGEGLSFQYSRRWQKYLLRLQQPPGANGKYVYDRELQYDHETTEGEVLKGTFLSYAIGHGKGRAKAPTVAEPIVANPNVTTITENYLRCIPLRNYNDSRTSREMQTGAPSQRHNVNTMYQQWLLEQESRLEYGWMKPRFSDTKYQLLPESYKVHLDHYYQVQYEWVKWWTTEPSPFTEKPVLSQPGCAPTVKRLDEMNELCKPITGEINRQVKNTSSKAQEAYVHYWLKKKVPQWQWIPPTMPRQDKTYFDPLQENTDVISEYCYLLYAWMQKAVVGTSLPSKPLSCFSYNTNTALTPKAEQYYSEMKEYTAEPELGVDSSESKFRFWNDSDKSKRLWVDKLAAMFNESQTTYFRRKAAFELWFDLCHGVWAPYLASWRRAKHAWCDSAERDNKPTYNSKWDPWLCDQWHMVVYNCNRWQPHVVEKRFSTSRAHKSNGNAEADKNGCTFKQDVTEFERIAPNDFAGHAEHLAVNRRDIDIDVPPVLLLCGMAQGKDESKEISLDYLGYQDTFKEIPRKKRNTSTPAGAANGNASDTGGSIDTDAGSATASDVASDAGNSDRDELEAENMDNEQISVVGAKHELFDSDDDTAVDTVISNDTILFGCALATRWNTKAKHNTRESTVLTDDLLEKHSWIVSPKYDGVRCRWNGTSLYSRTGNFEFQAPTWLTEALPRCALDGELWMGRNTFEQTWSTVSKRRLVPGEDNFTEWTNGWAEVYYVIFDCPGENQPYLKRLATAFDKISTHNQSLDKNSPGYKWYIDHLKVVGCIKSENASDQSKFWAYRVRSIDKINELLTEEQNSFGEGLIARKDDAPYTPGRSNFLVKIKAKRDDEAIVVYCGKGRGQFKGMMGYLWCRTRWGAEFDLSSGLSAQQRQWNTSENRALREGTVVTFTYTDLSSRHKRPKQSVFQRVRHDISASEFPGWECIADVDMFDS